MKRNHRSLVSISVAACVALVASAQTTSTSQSGAQGDRSLNTTARSSADSQKAMKHSGKVHQASDLIGKSVHNNQDEDIGEVQDIVVDLRSGRVIAVVVSSGGFLGVGEALNAIPPTSLQLAADQDSLRLNMSKEALREAPRFTAGQWPDFSDRNTTDGMNRAYPNSNQSMMDDRSNMENRSMADNRQGNWNTDADNSARNVRDRDNRSLTSGDQGNSAGDIQITQRIRQAVVAHNDLSVNAKNVKIVTNDGRVTLRGPVATAEEKKAIGEIANRIASGRVDNQLEVAAR